MGKKYIFMSQRDVVQMVEHGDKLHKERGLIDILHLH